MDEISIFRLDGSKSFNKVTDVLIRLKLQMLLDICETLDCISGIINAAFHVFSVARVQNAYECSLDVGYLSGTFH